jgi:hypothetical protein
VNGLQHSPEECARIQREIDKDMALLDGTSRDILKSIQDRAHDFEPMENNRLELTMARVSILLVKLSRDAERIADQNLKMQRTIQALTWAILVLTMVLVWIAARE